ncbi:plasmid pRiA4b ORF-3 family protein [Neoroseomonas soli]|uniref:Plasmid pRiA4b ORF-3 family protein n=1 Tax=Neoroseomonas soli TaxID=1081025 RepID=A0A9X9WTK7_9PROT|nr:plasmid pRiA4b ORF-3 family protein [Neoroseomonas soli]MBR0670486.1 plasmid pRiA4b ORF-3 family protein [Neoroseomonas soli]
MAAADSVNEICTLRIELCDSDPLIWRLVEVPTSITLKALHEVIQAAMGWFDYHLWEFTIGQRRFGLPMDEDWGTEPRIEARKVRLREILAPRKTTMTYVYDFGDGWEHRLILTNIRQGEPGIDYPRYVAGEGNAPPEDCGGIPGFYEKLDIAADPTHPEHDDIKEWLGDYDPNVIDALQIEISLGRIAKRRKAAKARIRKQTT